MEQKIKFTALFVKDKEDLLKRFPPKHSRVFAHHSTIEFQPENLNGIEIGKQYPIKIIGRAWDEFGDDLLVENPKSKNKYPHITLSRGENAPHLYSQILFNKTNKESHFEYFENEKVKVIEGYEKYLFTEKNVDFIKYENTVNTFLSNAIPSIKDCVSSYAIVIKAGKILLTDLKEGERPTRILDIPGGHIDGRETPEQSCERETFEETGVKVKVKNLIAYKKVTLISPKPENYRYPYPTSYMAFFLCETIEELPFDGNDDTHGRVWLPIEEFEKSDWVKKNKILLDEILREQ